MIYRKRLMIQLQMKIFQYQ